MNNVENGLYQLKKTDDRTEAVYIDQEVIEFAELNRRVKKQVEAAAYREAQNAAKKLHRERREMKRAMAKVRLMMQCAGLLGGAALVGFAAYKGATGIQIAAAIGAIALAVLAFKLGKAFGGGK